MHTISMVKIVNEQNYDSSYTITSNTRLLFTLLCPEQGNSVIINLSFMLEKDAFLRVEMLVANVDALISITCTLQGQNSYALVNGAYFVNNAHKVTINTIQKHETPSATSRFALRGVLNDYAQSFYSGMIFVPEYAHATVASQENKNIVLSENARALSIPQIEVMTDDVRCFHGSAVGRFDQDQLFYVATRGIDVKNAERLLLRGFFAGMFEDHQANNFLQEYL